MLRLNRANIKYNKQKENAIYHKEGLFMMYVGDLFTTRFGPKVTIFR